MTTFEHTRPTSPNEPHPRRLEEAELRASMGPGSRSRTGRPTQWQLIRRRFFRHKAAVISLVVLIVIFVMCFGAKWIAPYPKNQQDLLAPVVGPSRHHLFGVDQLGRDYFTEVLYAGQISLKIGLAVGLISTVIGFIAGAIAGYFGRRVGQPPDALHRPVPGDPGHRRPRRRAEGVRLHRTSRSSWCSPAWPG